MEWEPPDVVRVNATHGNGRRQPINPDGHPSTRPEDKDLIGKRAKWVSKEVLDQRREEGRCMHCGRDSCRLAICLLKIAVPSSRSQSSRINTTCPKAAVAEVDEEEDSSEDNYPLQGKE